MTEETPAELLRTRLRVDLRAAMKAQRHEEMAALRSLIAAVDNAEAVEASPPEPPAPGQNVAGAVRGLGATESARRSLSERDLRRLVQAELWERRAQADRLDLLGRGDEASRLRMEADVIARYETPGA